MSEDAFQAAAPAADAAPPAYTVLPSGDIEFDLAGQKMRLRPEYRALADIEKRTGWSLLGLLRKAHLLRDLSLRDATIVLHATAVLPLNSKEEEIGALVIEHGVTEVIPVVCEVLLIGIGGRSGKNREPQPAGAQAAPAIGSETATAGLST